MFAFIVIFSVLLVINALLLLFSSTLPLRFGKRSGTRTAAGLDYKDRQLNPLDKEYREAV